MREWQDVSEYISAQGGGRSTGSLWCSSRQHAGSQKVAGLLDLFEGLSEWVLRKGSPKGFFGMASETGFLERALGRRKPPATSQRTTLVEWGGLVLSV